MAFKNSKTRKIIIRGYGIMCLTSVLCVFSKSVYAAAPSCDFPDNSVPIAANYSAPTDSSDQYSKTRIAFDQLTSPNIAKALAWIHETDKNICHGYYLEPDIVSKYPVAPAYQDAPVTVTATNPAFFSQYGASTLSGDVTITQPGRQVTADEAMFYRDASSGQISTGTLIGNVHFSEYGKLIVAKDGRWNFADKSITLNNGVYRILSPSPNGELNAWGRARTMVRDADGVLYFSKATYSTCPPDSKTWKLWGNKVKLNKNTGRGTITNALFYVQDIPVFYLPYFDFPIDKRRKSGFLYPSFGYNNTNGFDATIPYYFNLAPNYDATITPRVMTKRGVLGQGLFRYLTSSSEGSLDLRYIPHDSEFDKFKQDSLTEYQPSHSLSRLEDASDRRGFFSYTDKTNFNQHWSGSIDLNYVTDDYFFQDFGNAYSIDDDQLLNQVDVKYAGETWNFLGRVQDFQTLHPITQSPTTEDQYRRLPQLDLNGDFPNKQYGLDYAVSSEFVNFDFDHKYDPTTGALMPVGGRFNLSPNVSMPLNVAGGYVTPKLQLQSTLYSLQNNLTPSNEMKNDITRSLPIFSVDSGAFYNRNTNLFGNNYMQTLEPRIFYLFVPNHDQNDIPIFDSTLSTFSFDQLFQTNRFSGLDRVGDANQVSVGLTTRYLDSYTAEEKFRASIGQMYLLHKHEVCINNGISGDCSSDPLADHYISPFVGEIQYDMNKYWDASANAAWDPNEQRFNNSGVNIKYHDGVNRIVSLGYNFVQHGDFVTGDNSDDLNRINLSLSWPIKEHWNVVGDWNYNISHDHPEVYFYGVEYQSCCWAIRVVQSQTFVGTDENDRNTFNHGVYFQFLFKGLGNVGNSNAADLLKSQIPDFRDNFAYGGKV